MPTVIGIGRDMDITTVFILLETAFDVINQPLVLLFADANLFAGFTFRQRLMKGGVHRSGAQSKCRAKGDGRLQFRPRRRFQVEALIAPPHSEVFEGGISRFGIGIFDLLAPVNLLVAYRHHDVGMHAIGQNVNVHLIGRVRVFFNCDAAKAKSGSDIQQNEPHQDQQGFSEDF